MIIVGVEPVMASDVFQATITPTGGVVSQTQPLITSTPSNTYTPSATPSPTSTTTLMPMPPITLTFPASTKTSTATMTPQLIIGTPTGSLAGSQDATISPRLRILVIILVILWLFLAGFLVIYIRQIT